MLLHYREGGSSMEAAVKERSEKAERNTPSGHRSFPKVLVSAGSALFFLVVGGLAMIFTRRRTVERPGTEALGYLKKHLGQAATTYLCECDALESPASQDLEESRLVAAYEAVRPVVEAYDDETAVAWFFGMNPSLQDRAPAYVLRHGSGPEQWRSVAPAAMEFVETAR
jgi:hypothetical protein